MPIFPPDGGGGGTTNYFAKPFANYSALLASSEVDYTVGLTQDDGMCWIRQENTWRPIRSRIFGNLLAIKDTSYFNFKISPATISSGVKDPLGAIVTGKQIGRAHV